MNQQPECYINTVAPIHNHHCLDVNYCLDPEIADVVHYLRVFGIETIASCSGREGHAFNYPMVRVVNATMTDLWNVLDAGNYDGYYIKTWAHCWHRDSGSFLEIEFWGLDCTQPQPNQPEREIKETRRGA